MDKWRLFHQLIKALLSGAYQTKNLLVRWAILQKYRTHLLFLRLHSTAVAPDSSAATKIPSPLWRTENGKSINQFELPIEITTICHSDVRNDLLIGFVNGGALLIDSKTQQVKQVFKLKNNTIINSVALSHNGLWAIAGGRTNRPLCGI